MRRSFAMISLLFVAGMPIACSFSKATEAEIRMDGGAVVGIDAYIPPNADGNNTFESDATVTCVSTNPMTTNLPPDILIVFDRSGSMKEDLMGMACANGDCGPTSKWTIATSTLNAYLPTVQTTVNWGLKLFGSTANGCNVNNMAEVAPGASTAARITTQFGRTMTGSSTPTTAAMMNAATYLKTLTDPNPKFILLATDGIPTCGNAMCPAGVNANNPNQCDDANAIAMVKTVHDMGFPTFVLGIGTANSPGDATLSSMAAAGGFPRNASPSYYPIGSAQDLTDAFNAIKGMVGNCFFGITPALTATQAVTGVTADGRDLAATDFTIVGRTGVQLTGQACTDFTAGTLKNVSVQVSCNG